jgi:hypothetical protein
VIKRENANWSRPKAERIAKKMNLPFLYALGYDYASTHVHPMANDGEDDFLRITRTARRSTADQITVLHNSVVILLLLIQTGLNASDLHWRAVLYDFLDHCILLLERGSREYTTTLAKIENAGLDFPWCQMPSASRDGA